MDINTEQRFDRASHVPHIYTIHRSTFVRSRNHLTIAVPPPFTARKVAGTRPTRVSPPPSGVRLTGVRVRRCGAQHGASKAAWLPQHRHETLEGGTLRRPRQSSPSAHESPSPPSPTSPPTTESLRLTKSLECSLTIPSSPVAACPGSNAQGV